MLHFELGPTASTLLYSTTDYGSKATLLLYFEHLSNSAPNVTEWVGARLSRTGGTASDLLDGRRVGPRAPDAQRCGAYSAILKHMCLVDLKCCALFSFCTG